MLNEQQENSDCREGMTRSVGGLRVGSGPLGQPRPLGRPCRPHTPRVGVVVLEGRVPPYQTYLRVGGTRPLTPGELGTAVEGDTSRPSVLVRLPRRRKPLRKGAAHGREVGLAPTRPVALDVDGTPPHRRVGVTVHHIRPSPVATRLSRLSVRWSTPRCRGSKVRETTKGKFI